MQQWESIILSFGYGTGKHLGLFYDGLFRLAGWKKLSQKAYFHEETEIYFVERPEMKKQDSIGPRHICLSALSREAVDAVHHWVKEQGVEIIRGPVEMIQYCPGYYTIDFRDPDGYIWEVAYIPI